MSAKSNIEWTEATWNPIVGCSIVSPGCTNCYAMRMAGRIQKMNRSGGSGSNYVNHYDGTTQRSKAGSVWTGKIARAPNKVLLSPLGRKKPTTYFVNSMGDLFHESIPDEWIDQVFAVMALCPQHTFQVLTKRAERMRSYLAARNGMGNSQLCHAINEIPARLGNRRGALEMPLPNVWLGVSCERQQEADERIPLLLQTPAAIRFVSAEPLLGLIDLTKSPAIALGCRVRPLPPIVDRDGEGPHVGPHLDWVIVGGESGPSARPMHPDWARSLRDQCNATSTPFFFKQWGEWLPGESNRGQFDPRPMHAYRRCDDHSYDWPNSRTVDNFGTHPDKLSGDLTARRIGKARAGRLLDGREHNEMPA